MVKGEQLNLLNKILFSLVIISICFIGCAKEAPNLPKDYSSLNTKNKLSKNDFTSEELKLSCEEISERLKKLNSLNNYYQSKTKNEIRQVAQVITIYGAPPKHSFPLLLPANTNSELNFKIAQTYRQSDILYKLQIFKNCKYISK